MDLSLDLIGVLCRMVAAGDVCRLAQTCRKLQDDCETVCRRACLSGNREANAKIEELHEKLNSIWHVKVSWIRMLHIVFDDVEFSTIRKQDHVDMEGNLIVSNRNCNTVAVLKPRLSNVDYFEFFPTWRSEDWDRFFGISTADFVWNYLQAVDRPKQRKSDNGLTSIAIPSSDFVRSGDKVGMLVLGSSVEFFVNDVSVAVTDNVQTDEPLYPALYIYTKHDTVRVSRGCPIVSTSRLLANNDESWINDAARTRPARKI